VAQAETVAFHLGGSDTTIDLDRFVGDDAARAAERRANDVVWAARPVHVTLLSPEQARATGLEPPEGVRSDVRVVEAEGFDRQPCGGTYPRTTAEVGVVLVTVLERYKGGTRVHFVCGDRATRLFAERQQVVGQLVATLSAPLDELPAAAQRLKDELAASDRRAKALLARALEGDARRLLADAQGAGPAPTTASPAIVVSILDGWPADDLRGLAQQLVALAPCVALLASRSDKAQLVFAQSEGLPHDIPGLLKAAVLRLGGRGGGRGNLAQGGGDRVELLDEALAQARASLGAAR
jgi:alanyl-tRNA synthetase